MGTPEFSVPMLNAIHESEHELLGVVTAPDKPAGRGRKLKKSAVKTFAEKLNIPVFQPKNLKSEDFQDTLHKLNPNVIVVVAFRMLPEQVWKYPKYGTFNLHASLLPDYRGAAPINWAIINGETQTGLTTFFIDDKIDTGLIIEHATLSIEATDNVEDVYDKMIPKGKELVLHTLDQIEKDNVIATPQSKESSSKIAPKLSKTNTKIDWSQPGEKIYNFIRGLSPYPSAWSILINYNEKINCKVLKSNFQKSNHNFRNGKVVIEDKKILVAVQDGFVELENIKISGKRLMKAKDLLNGFDIESEAKMA